MADTKISAFSEPTAPALTDVVAAVQSATNYKEQLKNLLGMLLSFPGGRLTLTTGVPVTTSDVTGATTIYWTPYLHGGIQLWDGNQWQLVVPGEISLALGTLTSGKPYDVFGFLSGGTLALEVLVWTNDTTRATAVTFQDGRLCKSGDKTRLLLGTFYTTSTTTTEDSAAKRLLSNLYHPVMRSMKGATETADTWNYSLTAYQQANANAANQLEFVSTYPMNAVRAQVLGFVNNSTSTGRIIAVGIGLDSTTVNSAAQFGATATTTGQASPTASYRATVAVGRHTLVWLEAGAGADTQTWYGDAGTPTRAQMGISGEVWN